MKAAIFPPELRSSAAADPSPHELAPPRLESVSARATETEFLRRRLLQMILANEAKRRLCLGEGTPL